MVRWLRKDNDDLLELKGTYAELWQVQSGEVTAAALH